MSRGTEASSSVLAALRGTTRAVELWCAHEPVACGKAPITRAKDCFFKNTSILSPFAESKEIGFESHGSRLLFNNKDNKYWYHTNVCLSHKPLNKLHCRNKLLCISWSVLIVCVQSLCSKHKVIWTSRGSPRSLGTNKDISVSRSWAVAPCVCCCVGTVVQAICVAVRRVNR